MSVNRRQAARQVLRCPRKLPRGEEMSANLAPDERLPIGPYAKLASIHTDGKNKAAARRRSRYTACAALNLNALLVFAKVAEANSFSEGARQLQIPVSTVSRQVADLEAQLGVRLLERSTRSLGLTGIGAEVLEEARATLSMRDSILGLISNRLSSVSGLLRISAPPAIANCLIAPVVGAFQASYPDVRVHIVISDRGADLSTGDFDLLVKVGPLTDSSAISRRILTFRDRLLASPCYLKSRKAPEAPNELLGHRLLALSSAKPNIEWSFVNSDHKNGVSLAIEPHLSVNDPASLTEALLSGMGIGNLPSMEVGELVRNGQLIELMPQWRFNALDVSVVHASCRHVRRPVREFIRFAAGLAPTLFPPYQGIDRVKHRREDASALAAVATM
jgi:DNA-binding transcriptional LysR family regulator